MNIGDRVVYHNPFDARFTNGIVKVMLYEDASLVGVEWENNFKLGNNLGGRISSVRGWWHYSEELIDYTEDI